MACELEHDKLKMELYKKYLAKPPSKRVNYLKLQYLSPFYLPFKSIITLNQSQLTNKFDQNAQFYILRDKRVLATISSLLFNRNKQQMNAKCLVDLNTDELSLSYTVVKLTSVCKGSIDKFSLLYPHSNEPLNDLEETKMCLNKLIGDYREEFLSKQDNETMKNKSKINKLIKHKFNKFDILTDENKFYEFESDLADCKEHRAPIGFVFTSGFSLANGKCTANALILTKYLIERINSKLNKELLYFQ